MQSSNGDFKEWESALYPALRRLGGVHRFCLSASSAARRPRGYAATQGV